jgi:phosphoribosylaminoimidazole-succinocarboxamide synthase
MGSVKNLIVHREPERDELGLGGFVFSDRYSVFDWGEMPDLIPEKGEVLATMGGFNFELLESHGISNHYLGMVEGEDWGNPKRLDSLNSPTDRMAIRLAHKPRVEETGDGYRYEDLTGWNNFLIPLEIVFRNRVPLGSSLRRRYDPEDVGLEYRDWPDEEIKLDRPMIEYSTKLERQDRYLDREEAYEISGLSEGEFARLGEIAAEVNRQLTEHASKAGFDHLDGKIECIYSDGEVLVADVVGTFDENRFSVDGRQISKEILRRWYRSNDEGWYEEVTGAKKKARLEGLAEWTDLVGRSPRSLEPDLRRLAADLYRAGANKWLGSRTFEAPEISELMEDIDSWKKKTN